MNMSFNLSEWVAHQKIFEPKTVLVEGVTLDLICLTDALKQEVKLMASYEDTILAAADYGVSYGRERFCDDAELFEYLNASWNEKRASIDCNPSLKHQVGIRVCEISGMGEYIADMKESEEMKQLEDEDVRAEEARNHLMREESNTDGNIVDGDKEIPHISLEKLTDDQGYALAV
tara:strand:+ start:4427 stop:4951 length:525 start_codon:yes stop_codon:yes gene_type:complete